MKKVVKLTLISDAKHGVTLDKATGKLVVVKIQNAKYGIAR